MVTLKHSIDFMLRTMGRHLEVLSRVVINSDYCFKNILLTAEWEINCRERRDEAKKKKKGSGFTSLGKR